MVKNPNNLLPCLVGWAWAGLVSDSKVHTERTD